MVYRLVYREIRDMEVIALITLGNVYIIPMYLINKTYRLVHRPWVCPTFRLVYDKSTNTAVPGGFRFVPAARVLSRI